MNQQVRCPFCNEEYKLISTRSGKLVEYRCSRCNSLLEVYHQDMHDVLRNLFHRTSKKGE